MVTSLQHAFVIMPLDGSLNAIFNNAIKPAIESLGVAPIRSDEDHFTGKITDALIDRIRLSYFLVAEITAARPNCYYEVGFAHATDRQVILLCQNINDVHFDLRDFPVIVYNSESKLREKLTARIRESILSQPQKGEEWDTRFGRYGRCAWQNGRLLTARIESSRPKNTKVTLQVIQTVDAPKLEGKVFFHLCNDFEPKVTYSSMARDGVAMLEISEVRCAFTVGALADNRKTRLELNLLQIPGADHSFYRDGRTT